MTPAERALRDAWVAEMWPTCREESREEREVKRALDAAYAQPVHVVSHKSTGTEWPEVVTECA